MNYSFHKGRNFRLGPLHVSLITIPYSMLCIVPVPFPFLFLSPFHNPTTQTKIWIWIYLDHTYVTHTSFHLFTLAQPQNKKDNAWSNVLVLNKPLHLCQKKNVVGWVVTVVIVDQLNHDVKKKIYLYLCLIKRQ